MKLRTRLQALYFPLPFLPSSLSLSYARQLGSADVEIKDTELQNVLSLELGGGRNIVVYVSPAARNCHFLIPFRVQSIFIFPNFPVL